MPLTEAKAEQMRAELAAHEEAKRAEALAAETGKRAAARAVVQPVADYVEKKLKPVRAELLALAEGLGPTEWDLANLVRNIVQTADGVIDRTARRMADTEPPVADPTPSVPTPAA